MNISWKKIGLFFLVLLVLGWFLYPRDLFLGFIYEGLAELKQSEKHYHHYLEKYPHSKFATLRLVNLYDRMGEPQKGTPLLQKLYEHRKSDWSIAQRYLDHLENINDAEALQQARLTVARTFMSQARFSKRKVSELLYDSYLHARWVQNNEEAYAILLDLMKSSDDSKPYEEEIINLHRGLQQPGPLKDIFLKRIAGNPKDIPSRMALAEVYIVLKEWDEALKVLENALSLSPQNKDLLESKIYVELKKGNKKRAIQDIAFLLTFKKLQKEEGCDWTDTLAFLYDDIGEKEKALVLHQRVWEVDRENPERWLAFATALSGLHRWDESIALLQEYQKKFGSDFEQQKLIADIYLYEKKETTQIPFYKSYVLAYHQPGFALDVGYLLLDRKMTEEAIEWLEFAQHQFSKEAKISGALVDLYIAEKEYDPALQLTLEYLERDPKNADFHHRAAILYGQTQKPREAEKEYQLAFARKPNDPSLQADYAYFLMEQKKYKKAIPYLEKVVARNSEEKVYHRDLGEAYTRSGFWQKGMKEFEIGEAKRPLKELHKMYDHRVKALYGLTDFGSEEYMEWGAVYQGYFSEPLEFKGETFVGHFTSPSSGFEGEAEYGKFLLASHHLEKWIFDGGVGFGFSNRRETLSPFADITFTIPDLISLKAGYQYRQLRTDLPQAVAQGDLIDTARFNGHWIPWDRLNIGVLYEFVRDVLPAGQKAYEHQLEPTIHFVITKKPYFTIGYQYTFIQVFGRSNFLTLVPLIQKMRAHYATGYLGYPMFDNFLFEASGFIGEDTTRDLEFVKGELWGAHAGMTWNINSWCDLDAGYDYGREFLFNVSGRYQHLVVGLSGHWF